MLLFENGGALSVTGFLNIQGETRFIQRARARTNNNINSH